MLRQIIITTVLLLAGLILPVKATEDDRPNVTPLPIQGEWIYDFYRSGVHRAESAGVGHKLDETTRQQMREMTDTLIERGSLPRMTITDTAIIHHADKGNERRVTPYEVIGGNANLVTLEVERGGWKQVVQIQVDDQGLFFLPLDCESYPAQCERMKQDFFEALGVIRGADVTESTATIDARTDAGNITADTRIGRATPERLEQLWQQQLQTRNYYRPAADT